MNGEVGDYAAMGFQFEELHVWQRSKSLAVSILLLARDGAWAADWDMRSQVKRASISISSNIAEGMERDSVKDTVRFLRISKGSVGELVTKGSVGELVTQLMISKEAGLLDPERADALLAETRIVAGMLVKFIGHLERREGGAKWLGF